MATGQDTVRSYIGDLIAALRHVSGAIEKQCRNDDLAQISGAPEAIAGIDTVLKRHIIALEVRADDMGGTGAISAVKDAVTSVTGFVTGLYGAIRSETASRMLRDDYAALTFVSVCTAMLHTTALAVGDAATAQLTRQHLNDFPPIIMALNDLLPRAVIADLAADDVTLVDIGAAETAVEHMTAAWRTASTQGPPPR